MRFGRCRFIVSDFYRGGMSVKVSVDLEWQLGDYVWLCWVIEVFGGIAVL